MSVAPPDNDFLRSELRKDTEPQSFCQAGNCPGDFELNYDGSLLAASTFASTLPEASWSELTGKLIKPFSVNPGFFVIGLLFSAESTSTLADRKLVQETLTYQSNNEHGQPPQATEYPADVPVEAGVYPLPEDKSLPIHFNREADQRQGLILEHPGTGERVLVYYSQIDGLSVDHDGKVILDMFGGKHSMNPGAINLDTRAESGIRGSAMDLPVKTNSVDEIVTSNPYIPRELSRTKSIMDWLPEAARVLKPGGEININAFGSNPYGKLPKEKELILESLELEVVIEKEQLLERFRNQEFFKALYGFRGVYETVVYLASDQRHIPVKQCHAQIS